VVAESRHVRRLRLDGPSDALIRRGVTLLEDALRTASFEGESEGRMLVVRRLASLDIDVTRSPAALSRTIEHRVRTLSLAAVHGCTPQAEHAAAVYFLDVAEPYRLLAARVARGDAPNAWFWPIVVPGYRPEAPAAETLRAIALGALATTPGVAVLVALVEELVREGTIDALCVSLRREDGAAMLAAAGISLASPGGHERLEGFVPPLPRHFRSTLTRWSRTWGSDDPRSVWLSSVALVADRPARLVGPGLGAAAGRALAALERTIPTSAARDERERPLAARAQEASRLRSPGARDPLFKLDEIAPDPSPSVDAEGPATTDLPPMPELSSKRADPRRDAAAIASDEPTDSHGPELNRTDQPEDDVRAPVALGERLATTLGGLYFLVAVLERLGMSEWLAATPPAVEWQFPIRVLRAAVESVHGDPSDPAMAPLGLARGEAPDAFVAPARWWTGWAREGDLRLRPARGGAAFVVDDGPGGLPLAAWTGACEVPDAVRAFAGARHLAPGPPFKTSATPTLLRAWLIASRRWLARYANLSLSQLICRSAHVVMTRTHVDVVQGHAAVDLRVRRAGLDVDAGWVPWLGRVVAFHYVDSPMTDRSSV
jgi:hypothetical protein